MGRRARNLRERRKAAKQPDSVDAACSYAAAILLCSLTPGLEEDLKQLARLVGKQTAINFKTVIQCARIGKVLDAAKRTCFLVVSGENDASYPGLG